MQRHLLRIKSVEDPPVVEEGSLDHRVPLKRREGVIEALRCRGALDSSARETRSSYSRSSPVNASSQTTGSSSVPTEGPAQNPDVAVVVAASFDAHRKGLDGRDGGHAVHAWAVRKSEMPLLCVPSTLVMAGLSNVAFGPPRLAPSTHAQSGPSPAHECHTTLPARMAPALTASSTTLAGVRGFSEDLEIFTEPFADLAVTIDGPLEQRRRQSSTARRGRAWSVSRQTEIAGGDRLVEERLDFRLRRA